MLFIVKKLQLWILIYSVWLRKECSSGGKWVNQLRNRTVAKYYRNNVNIQCSLTLFLILYNGQVAYFNTDADSMLYNFLQPIL